MNREDAYNRIDAIIEKHEVDDVYVTINNHKDYDALRFARKLLEQEHCEDAISRQAVLNALYALCDTGETLIENPWRDNPHIDAVIETIEELPTVNPQPKTGHWIPVSEELPDKEGYYLCSVRYMYPPYNFFEPEKVKYMDDVTIQKFDGEFNIEVKAWMPLPLPWEGE